MKNERVKKDKQLSVTITERRSEISNCACHNKWRERKGSCESRDYKKAKERRTNLIKGREFFLGAAINFIKRSSHHSSYDRSCLSKPSTISMSLRCVQYRPRDVLISYLACYAIHWKFQLVCVKTDQPAANLTFYVYN